MFNLQSQTDASQCDMNVPSLLANENVMGPMASLPGGIQLGEFVGDLVDGVTDVIGGGQDPALGGGGSNASPEANAPGNGVDKQPMPETPVESVPVQPASAAPVPAEPAPAAPVAEEPVSKESAYETPVSKESTPEQPQPAEPVITEAPKPVVPEEDLDIVSTEYVRDGNVLSKIVWVEEVFYVTETAYETCTVTVEPPKAKRARAHMHRHSHRHH